MPAGESEEEEAEQGQEHEPDQGQDGLQRQEEGEQEGTARPAWLAAFGEDLVMETGEGDREVQQGQEEQVPEARPGEVGVQEEGNRDVLQEEVVQDEGVVENPLFCMQLLSLYGRSILISRGWKSTWRR